MCYKIELQLFTYLNDHDDRQRHVFDCGEEGIIDIWWGRHGWEYRWLKLEPLPFRKEGE